MSSILSRLIVAILLFCSSELIRLVSYYDNSIYVRYMAVGMGDASLIKYQKGSILLVDGGPDISTLAKLNLLLPYGIRGVNYVIVSHSHADHITGLIYLLNEYNIGCIIYKNVDSPITVNEEIFRGLIRSKNIPVNYENMSNCPNKLPHSIDLYYPPFGGNRNLKNENDESLLVLFRFENAGFIFTGDAEFALQNYYLNDLSKSIPETDINSVHWYLKVPHQGSIDSLNKDFIQYFNPVLAVIYVGKNNYGHPHKPVLDYYKSKGIPVHRTDIMGDKVVSF